MLLSRWNKDLYKQKHEIYLADVVPIRDYFSDFRMILTVDRNILVCMTTLTIQRG